RMLYYRLENYGELTKTGFDVITETGTGVEVPFRLYLSSENNKCDGNWNMVPSQDGFTGVSNCYFFNYIAQTDGSPITLALGIDQKFVTPFSLTLKSMQSTFSLCYI